MHHPVTFRAYESADETAVWHLHEWAIRETGVDPTAIPGTDDLRSIETSYFDAGGEFIVGIAPAAAIGRAFSEAPRKSTEQPPHEALTTYDGVVVAMGGYLPNEAGHADERDRPGAAELHRMRVAPPWQRRGYGSRVLHQLEERAAADGFDTVVATTSTTQSAALSFYQTHGYQKVGQSTAGDYELVHFEKQL